MIRCLAPRCLGNQQTKARDNDPQSFSLEERSLCSTSQRIFPQKAPQGKTLPANSPLSHLETRLNRTETSISSHNSSNSYGLRSDSMLRMCMMRHKYRLQHWHDLRPSAEQSTHTAGLYLLLLTLGQRNGTSKAHVSVTADPQLREKRREQSLIIPIFPDQWQH